MIAVKKKMKKSLLIIILAASLAVLTVAAVLLNAFTKAQGSGDGGSNTPVVDTLLGEDIYGGKAIAFTRVSEAQIQYIDVVGRESRYGFTRVPIKDDGSDTCFKLHYYEDGSITPIVYLPEIAVQDPYFEYESLYAKEQQDSFGEIYKLTYLCTALGTTYFDEKISTPTNEDKAPYGLAPSDNPLIINFTYTVGEGENKKTESHKIQVGDALITGSGYYFTVDDRPYVYSTSNSYFNYAFLNCYDYINPILTAAGLSGDKSFEPYLTTGFHQWLNTMYDTEGTVVLPGSEVTVNATIWQPKPENEDGGYLVGEEKYESFDLSVLEREGFDLNILSALEYEKIGELETEVWITLPVYSREVDFTEKTTNKYTYQILAVESVITPEGKEIYTPGTPVGENDIVKVVYHIDKEGTEAIEEYGDYHAILKISDIPDSQSEAKQRLKNAKVGDYTAGDIFLEMNYTKENTVKRHIDTVVTEILAISDSDNKELKTIIEGARVAYRYTLIVDGVRAEGFDEAVIVINDELDEYDRAIADAIMGLEKGRLDKDKEVVIDSYTAYCEIMADFTTYKVNAVKYFTTSENVVSFKFEQASKRNPYYGDSLYTNIMTNQYSMYGLNSSACESILRLFGGAETNATNSTGLIGTKTIDIGITPEKLYKYGLYAHKIYFEIPRGIETVVYSDVTLGDYLSALDDYTYYSTLGFTLYISDENPKTGTRYIASDMYDVIAEIDAKNFKFLEESFVEFYARRNLVLTNISNISDIDIEVSFDDLYGSYSNELEHVKLYAYDGRLYLANQLTAEELAKASPYDMINVMVTPYGDCITTEFSKFLEDNNIDRATLYEFFDKKTVELDTLGTYNFKEFVGVLFFIHYEGSLSEEEQTSEAANNAKILAKLKVGIINSAKDYVYEFYRIADSRVMVKIYEADVVTGEKLSDGKVVSDFYISMHSFKKLIGTYFEMLNKNNIDAEIPYPEF